MKDSFYIAYAKNKNILLKSHYCYKDYFGRVFLGENPYHIVEIDFDTLYYCSDDNRKKIRLEDIYLLVNYKEVKKND